MAFSITGRQGKHILKLEGAVLIQQAHDLAGKLGESLDEGTAAAAQVEVEVDTRDLEDIDTGMLQVLCALSKTVRSVSFEDPSEAFLRALDRCGMRRELLGGRGNS
jgi:anti-anti-sigma regulatory factor